MADRCPICDRPFPTVDQDEFIPAGGTATLCWGGPDCERLAVDWRARALAAEARLEDLERPRMMQPRFPPVTGATVAMDADDPIWNQS